MSSERTPAGTFTTRMMVVLFSIVAGIVALCLAAVVVLGTYGAAYLALAKLTRLEEVESLLRSKGGVAISASTREGLASLLAKADTTLFAEGATEAIGAV